MAMNQITIKTTAGVSYTLTPVPMPRFPSDRPEDWNRFQGLHVPGTLLSEREQDRLRGFMKRCKTEALTDGKENYTLAGGLLAKCFPEAIQPQN
jgi:hypothetical protein